MPIRRARFHLRILFIVIFGLATFLSHASCSVGPPMREHLILVEKWSMDVPNTVFGIEKFGIRQGHFLLHIERDGEQLAVPIDPEILSKFCYDKGWFAGWKREEELKKIADLKGTRPLLVHLSSRFYNSVVEVKVLDSPCREVEYRELPFDYPYFRVWGCQWPERGTRNWPKAKVAPGKEIRLPRNDEALYLLLDRPAWEAVTNGSMKIPSQEDYYLDPDTQLACVLWLCGLIPALVFVFVARKAVA